MTDVSTIKAFISERTGDYDLANRVIYLCHGGSRISGTNDSTSDYDFRAIYIPTQEELFGTRSSSHLKLVGGEGGINRSGDFDVELFSLHKFLRDLAHGEPIATDMAFVDYSFQLEKHPVLNSFFDSRDIFISLAMANKYLKLAESCCKKAFIPLESLKHPDKIARVERYGFETKMAMNASKNLDVVLDLLQTGEISIYRPDYEQLLAIKKGEINRNDFLAIYDTKLDLIHKLMDESKLPERVNFAEIDLFMANYLREVYRYFGLS